MARNINILKRYKIIQQEVLKYYEPGNQAKSKAQAFRNYIVKVYPMSERTFWEIMGTDVDKEMKTKDNGQLSLFD